jgi:hypothetical protein
MLDLVRLGITPRLVTVAPACLGWPPNRQLPAELASIFNFNLEFKASMIYSNILSPSLSLRHLTRIRAESSFEASESQSCTIVVVPVKYILVNYGCK